MVRPRSCLLLFVYLFVSVSLFSQTASSDFTFVLLPDTQNEAQFFPLVLSSQTQWIVNNRGSLNIQGVFGLGDIVNDGASAAQQGNADSAIGMLDTANVPYFLAIGNHDYDGGEDAGVVARAVTGFNQWWGPARYAGKNYYQGNFPSGSNENFYGVLTINGKQYLILVLEFIPRTTSLNWAASVVQANPDKEVIVITHSFLFVDGTTADRCDTEDKPRADNDGEQMWESFVSKHPNIIMVVNGHLTAGEAARRADLGVNGNLINSMFSNYQTDANGGDGWLRIVTFHPGANTISVQTYSPYLNAYRTDSDNQFTVNYHDPGFHTGVGKITGRVTGSGCQVIAGATVSAGGASATTDAQGRFSLQLSPGSYQVNASAPNWRSGTRTVQVNDNYSSDINFYMTLPPPCPLQGAARSVTICTPATGTTVNSPVHLVAATSEPVMRLEIWTDGSKAGEVPGNVVDTNLTLGSGHHDVIVTAVEVDTSTFSGQASFNISSSPAPTPPASGDFAVSAMPPSQTVKHGESATYNIGVAAQNGAFNSTVTLSCSGLPTGATCSFAPNSVTPGSSTAGATLTISTPAPVASLASPRSLSPFFAVTCAVFFSLVGVVSGVGRQKRIHKFGILCLVFAGVLALQSCGRGVESQPTSPPSSPTTPNSGSGTSTSPTTSTVTIVATSGSTAHSTTVTLTVQ